MVQNEAPHRGSLVMGILLILGGAFFLLSQLLNVSFAEVAWPLFIIVPGLLLLAGGLVSARTSSGLTIAGTIVTVVGLILFVQSLTGRYDSWPYAWALIAPGAVGLGQVLHGLVTHQPALVKTGQRSALIGLAIFVVGWVFFEQAINLNGFGNLIVGRLLGPAILVALGGLLLWNQWRATHGKQE